LGARTGIRDLGYKRYDGPRLPHRSRFRVLVARTLSLAWANGLVKTALILGMFPMVVSGVYVFIKTKIIHAVSMQAVLPIQIEDPGVWVYYTVYWCQLWFAFTMSLMVAAPAISEDVRTGAFQFYFARPVARSHYLVGKMLPVAILILAVTAIPGLLVAIERVALSRSGDEALKQLPLLLKTLLYVPVFAATLALPPVALSSFSRRTGTVQGGWAALFFLPWILGEGMATATGVSYVALISIPTNLRLVGQYLYGVQPSYAIPWYYPAGVLAALLVVSAALLLRRLERVEVFT
jgi:ABC-type transport system involved in multi-copper enzyme maturation permease subunit